MRPDIWKYLTFFVFGVVVLTNLSRAASLAITFDEAMTWIEWVDVPLRTYLEEYDANNHLLHTYLCRILLTILPANVLTLRLVGISSSVLILWSIYRLSILCFASQSSRFLVFSSLVLNPFLMDYMILARGYGLGLGLFLSALTFTLDCISHGRSPLSWKVAVLMALSCSANLIYVFPAASLAICIAVYSLGQRHLDEKRWLIRVGSFTMVGGIVFLGLSFPYLIAHKSNFYYGAASMAAGVRTLIEATFYHDVRTTSQWPWNFWATQQTITLVSNIFEPLLFVMTIAFWGSQISNRFRISNEDLPTAILLSTISLTLGLYHICHFVFQLPYPHFRTGLPVLVLGLISIFTFTFWLEKQLKIHRSLFVALLATVIIFAESSQFPLHHPFQVEPRMFRFHEVLATLSESHRRFPEARFNIAVDWLFSYQIIFYTKINNWNWLKVNVIETDDSDTFRDRANMIDYHFYLMSHDAGIFMIRRPISSIIDDDKLRLRFGIPSEYYQSLAE